MTTTETLRETREALVREHMESENRHEFDVTIADDPVPPRVNGKGEVVRGEE